MSRRSLDRREFLRTLGLGALGVGAGLSCRPKKSDPDSAAPARNAPWDKWGDYPAEARALQLPEDRRAQSVLEVYLAGGICPWETFYAIDEEDYGKAKKEMWWTFQEGPENVATIYRKCLGTAAPGMLQDFALDQNKVMVKLGPFVHPLRERPDITSRLRLHVMTHDIDLHEAAVPLALTGYRLASPRLAGLGTAIQHNFLPRDTSAREPLSYVIAPHDRTAALLTSHAIAAGMHGASARPLMLQVSNDHRFVQALQRGTLGSSKAATDALLAHAMARYESNLRHDDAAVRSRVWDEYQYAVRSLKESEVLGGILKPSLWEPMSGEVCGEVATMSTTGMQLRLAGHLLGRPNSPTRHVTVVDTALLTDLNDGSYDTHRRHVFDSGRNLTYFWQQLASIINKPGEKDPAKIDLDKTMVVFNTEFGREPGKQGTDGRNHWPKAYVTAMFGGPIGPKQRGIVGSIDLNARATDSLNPPEQRAAVLVAMGIWPFSPEVFSPGDFKNVRGAEKAAAFLREKVLGLG